MALVVIAAILLLAVGVGGIIKGIAWMIAVGFILFLVLIAVGSSMFRSRSS